MKHITKWPKISGGKITGEFPDQDSYGVPSGLIIFWVVTEGNFHAEIPAQMAWIITRLWQEGSKSNKIVSLMGYYAVRAPNQLEDGWVLIMVTLKGDIVLIFEFYER